MKKLYTSLITILWVTSKTFLQDLSIITRKSWRSIFSELYGRWCYQQLQMFNHTLVCRQRIQNQILWLNYDESCITSNFFFEYRISTYCLQHDKRFLYIHLFSDDFIHLFFDVVGLFDLFDRRAFWLVESVHVIQFIAFSEADEICWNWWILKRRIYVNVLWFPG